MISKDNVGVFKRDKREFKIKSLLINMENNSDSSDGSDQSPDEKYDEK